MSEAIRDGRIVLDSDADRRITNASEFARERHDETKVEHVDEFDQLRHRGSVVSGWSLVGELVGHVQHRFHDEPQFVSETEVLEATIASLRKCYPAWFSDTPRDVGETAEVSIDTGELREEYWGGQLAPEYTDIDTTDRGSIQQVVVPVVGFVLDQVIGHTKADRKAEIDAATDEIAATIMRQVTDARLSREEAWDGVEKAMYRLEQHDHWDDDE